MVVIVVVVVIVFLLLLLLLLLTLFYCVYLRVVSLCVVHSVLMGPVADPAVGTSTLEHLLVSQVVGLDE